MTDSVTSEINIQHWIAHDLRNLPNCGLNIFYANACSILRKGKFDKLKDILDTISHEVHVILLTETWFKKDSDAATVNLDNYVHYYNFRDGAKGGGISIYVKKWLKPQLTTEKYKKKVNYLWVYLESKKMNIGVVYKPELNSAELKSFLEVYSSQLKERPRAVVFGDFNFNLLEYKNTTNYMETIKQASFTVLNKIDDEYFTRRASGTIIDHACTNLDPDVYKFHLSVIRSNPLSDHDHLYLGISSDMNEVDEEDLQTNASDTCQMNHDDHTRAARIQNSRRQTLEDTVHLSDDDEEVQEPNGTRTARPRKKKRVDIEYSCHICFLVHEDAATHLKHLRDDHQYTGSIEEKYAIRKCPHCVSVRLTQKDYNKHIWDFHSDAARGSTAPSTATASTAPTNTTVSINSASSNRATTTITRPVSSATTSVATSANSIPTSTNSSAFTRSSVPSARSSNSSVMRSLPVLE